MKFVESPAHAKYFVGIFERDRGENPDSILIVTTNRREFYADKVEICGVNTSGLPVLSAKKTDELLKKSAAGNKQARDELIRGNLRLVLSVVQRFQGRGESPDDLFQVGCIGLMKAIDNFNTELGVRFSTYAVPMIIGEIRRYLRDNSAMRVSRSLRDTAYRALQAKEHSSASTSVSRTSWNWPS